MKIATLNLHRYFLVLLAILFWHSPLSAQATSEDGRFYLDFDGSAVFPYDPNPLAGLGLKAGSGFTAAFKEGFSTEIEWGYQKVGIGDPSGLGGTIGAVVSIGDGWTDSEVFLPPTTTVKIGGEIKTQSLMGNAYYRYPKWRVSPYVGFGLGAFFHDETSTVSVEFGPLPPPTNSSSAFPVDPSQSHTKILGLPIRSWGVSRFGSTSAWSFTLAIAFAPAGGNPSIPTRLSQASGSGFDANPAPRQFSYSCRRNPDGLTGLRVPSRTLSSCGG